MSSLPCWWNASEQAFSVQLPSTGEVVQGKATLGTNGFLLATWPDGSTWQSEVVNLALKPADAASPVRKRPAACHKKPAALESTAEDNSTELAPAPLKRPAAACYKKPAALEPAAEASNTELVAAAAALEPPAAIVYSPSRNKAESASLGLLRKFCGTDKAYIQQWLADEKRWKSVVNVTSSCCNGTHVDIINQLMKHALQPGATSQSVLEQKKKLAAAALETQ